MLQSSRFRTLASLASAAAAFCFTLVLLPGCNTVKGAGEDLQEASDTTREAIEDATD